MRTFVIPSQENNHTPHLLNKTAMIVYTLFIFSLNFLLPFMGVFKVSADITIQELLEMHNQIREENGLLPVKLNQKLASSATNKSLVMMQNDCWSHYCPEGTSPWEFFDEVGYVYINAGENLAEGFSDTETVMNAWMNSPTHRENILNGKFDEIGFGFAYGYYQGRENNVVVAVHFGKAAQNVASANDISVSDNTRNVTINEVNNIGEEEENILEVKGNVTPEGSSVRININDTEAGRVLADGPNYIFRSQSELEDGSYKINTELLDSDSKIIGLSADEHKILDNNLPFVLEEKAEVELTDTQVLISLKASEDTSEVISDMQFRSSQKTEDNNFSFEYLKSSIENTNSKNITFTLVDRSGNEAFFQLDINKIKEKITSNNLSKEIVELESVAFGGDNVRFMIIAGIVIYLTVLMLIDFLVLTKTKMLAKVNRKSHLQFSVFIILLIILNVSGFSGAVLNGSSI
jgi:hypothetical protein